MDTETATDLPRIRALMEQYRDLPADFADASLLALCERRRITTVASVDFDFTLYRMQNRRGFRNLLHPSNRRLQDQTAWPSGPASAEFSIKTIR